MVRFFSNDTSLTIKEGTEQIISNAFQNKYRLTEVIFPESLNKIDSQSFDGCSGLTSISLGKNIKKLDSMSIYGSAIENINIDNDNPNYSIVNGALYNKDGTIFISPIKKIGNITTYTIPVGVNEISDYAFHNQNKMTEITLPTTLKKIGLSFNYCTSLPRIEIPNSVTSISATCFSSCGNTLKEVIIHKAKGSISGSPWGLQYGDKGITWVE